MPTRTITILFLASLVVAGIAAGAAVVVLASAGRAPSPPPTVVYAPERTPSAADTPGQLPGTFTVVGTATIDVAPDTAELRVTVTAEASRPAAAARAARAKQSKLETGFAALGIAGRDLQLSHLRISPVWDYQSQRVRAYVAAIDVVTTTKDFDRVADLMEAAADAGAGEMSTTFRADLVPLKQRVREQALAAARSKAEQVTTALDVELGKVVTIDEGAYEGRYGGWGEGGGAVANVYEVKSASAAATTTGALEPLTATVRVTYQLP